MAEFSSPITGGLRIRRSRIPSYTFLNRPQEEQKPREDFRTTLALQQNKIAIDNINSSLLNVSSQVSALNASLQGISNQIVQTSALEQTRDRQKQQQENALAEQQLREGKESVVESKIQTALLAPLRKVGAKAQFTLSRLGNFFMILLGGFLGGMVVDTIAALVSGDKEKLEDLKKKFLDNIGIVGGIFLAFSGGFSTILSYVTRLARRLGSAALKNLLIRPVNVLIKLVQGIAQKIPGVTPRGKTASPTTKPSGSPSGSPSSSSPKSGPKVTPRGASPLGGLLGRIPLLSMGIQGITDIVSGESVGRTAAGTLGVGALGVGASLINPYVGLAALIFGAGPAARLSKDLYEQSGLEQQFPQLGSEAKGGIFNLFEKMSGTQVELQKKKDQIPELTEPETSGNFTVINNGVGGGNESGPTFVPSASGNANYLPNVPSSNPENFYVLYSQIQYNVIG